MSGSNSVVECQLPKLNVAGSIPVSRSNRFNSLPSFQLLSDGGKRSNRSKKLVSY